MTPAVVRLERLHAVRSALDAVKVRATAFVRVEVGTFNAVLGPYRVVAGPAQRPKIYAPSTRMSGSWVECVVLDEATSAAVGDAILEGYAKLLHANREAAGVSA